MLLRLLLIIVLLGGSMPALSEDDERDIKAVLVTGASSGIGLNITRRLAADGYRVYAGARKDEDIAALDEIDNVVALRLDVTYPEHIEAAVSAIEDAGLGLYGVVNNAGVAFIGPLTETGIEDLEWMFDVNVYGPYRVTSAVAPLLFESQGRVVNISSISGILSGGLFGQYSMSKHAIEAYTDSLAAELLPFGIGVSAIEPGNFNSGIGGTIENRTLGGSLDLENSRYTDRLKFILQRTVDRSGLPEPDAVAEAVSHALFDPQPRRRYLVTGNQREAEVTIRKAIEELVQLNGGHQYSYKRDQLVQMLDEELQRSRLAENSGR